MRKAILPATVFAAVAMLAASAHAGTVTTEGGKVSWQSTRCAPPGAPPSLPGNPETPANSMNAGVANQAAYNRAVQDYATCVSREAQEDANTVSKAIIAAAQGVIQQQQQNVLSVTTSPVRGIGSR